jgi:rifampicin phosphotransferase
VSDVNAVRGPTVLDLDDESARDSRTAGTKAAVLAQLRSAGLPVPEGVVLIVGAASALAGDHRGPSRAAHLAASAAVRRLGDVPVAVRSSGVAEDLPDASFAGQYETIIGVSGVHEIAAAVERCIASGRSERVGAYAAARGTGPGDAMAVLIQRLVSAEAAGVAFTADPISGDRDEVTVSAVAGMGEALVSGAVTPDEWIVRAGGIQCLQAPQGAVDEADVRSIAELARRVESLLGAPQDIEWAIEGGRLWLLQSRPITALPQPPVIDVPTDGFWTKDDAHHPWPLTPFGASVYLPTIEQAMPVMISDFGLPFERVLQRSFGGEVYTRVVPPGGKDRPAPPWWVIAVATRVMPGMRRREKAARRALDTNLVEQLLEQWPGWRAAFVTEVSALRGVDVAALDDDDLAGHLGAAVDLLARGQVVHFRLFVPYALALYQLAMVCEELLGWPPERAVDLVSGTSAASSEPGRALAELAAAVRGSDPAFAIVRERGADALQHLPSAAPDVARAVDDYIDRYGHRPMSYDPGEITLAERPGLLMGLLRDELDRSVSQEQAGAQSRSAQALTEVRSRLTRATGEDRRRFEDALRFAALAYPTREDNSFVVDSLPCGLIRRAAMEFGRRLEERGAIAAADDVVFLEDHELRSGLLGQGTDLRALVRRRKAERAWVLAHPGPPTYGKDPGPPPDLRGMPRGLRSITGALLWIADLFVTKRAGDEVTGTDELRGVAGSPGRATGRVCVVRDESQFDRLLPGDILVCPTTSPAWSVLFTKARGLVTDGGGVLAHAAVIAREYGVPAVLATGDATRRLRDGDIVTVDGTLGTVVIEVATTHGGGPAAG